MKRNFTRILAAFALLVGLTFPMGVWGQTATFSPSNFSGQGTSGTGSAISATVDGVTFACDKGYGTTQIRCYSGGIITISSSNTITAITFTFSGSYTGGMETSYTDLSAISWTQTLSSQARITACTVTYTGGDTPQPNTYTVTFDAGEGTFVGNEDFPNANNTDITGGNHTLPTATPPTGYNFNGWTASGITTPVNGTYNIAADIDFTASYSNADEHTYNFAGANNFFTDAALTTHPGSGSSNNVETIYYGDGSTFVASGTSRYFSSDNSGYFLLGKSGAQISLPTFEGYKITQVKLHSSSGHSTSVAVSIVSGSNTASTAQTWSTKDHDYVYDIASDYQTSVLSVNVANGYNTQFTSITLVCEADVPSTDPSITASNVEVAYNATSGIINYTVTNPVDGASVVATSSTSWIGTTFSYGNNNSVTFSVTEQNPTNADRQGIITLTYGDNLATKDVTITQAAAPVHYTTIPTLFTAATGTETNVLVTFNNWVVSGVSTNGKNVFVTDNEGHGFVIYNNSDMSNTYAAGNVLSGTAVFCTLKLYNGFAELLNVNATDLTITTGGNVTEANVAMADLAGVNTGALVHYDNLICSIDNNKYYLSDGTTTIQIYNTLYSFTELEDGKTYNITGIYQQFNSTKEILPRSAEDIEEVVVTEPSITVSPSEITVNAEYHQDVLTVTYENLDPTSSNPVAIFYDAEGHETNCSWLWVELQSDWNFRYTIFANEGEARTAYFKIRCNGVYSEMVTVSQAAYVAPVTGDKYVKVASADDLTDGQYLIVYEEGSVAFNGGLETLDATSNTIEVTISNNEIAVAETTAAAEFTIDVTNGTLKSASGKYIGVSTNSNGLKQTDDASTYTNSFSIDESGNAVIAAVFEGSSMTLRYNSASNQNRFRYYTSGQKAIQLYKKAETTPTSPTITVNGYGDTDGGYVLIASPTVEYADPVSIGMATGNYDLYYFDAEQELEWRNYKAQDGGNYNLEPGKGYLYANQETVTITFTGDMNPSFSDVELPYTENDVIKSLYLAGNSSTQAQTFYVNDGNFDHQTFNYLTINEDGNGFISAQATSYTAPAMTGFFVQAPGEGMALSTYDINAKANVSLLNINVLRDRGSIIDNAIVSFSNGSMMDKFYLKNNTTRVYIPQGNREMAIANSAAQGEMPVSFRAAENGTYTLSIETENVEMDYLHLIDNMTGMDVDLLATPNYTFEARKNDYTSRFRLVFSANGIDEQNAETFAYFNGSEWMVSNLGEATLQVVDVMGRVLSTETISGNAELSLNQPAGVYMLRLINGNDVKVQKVIVK